MWSVNWTTLRNPPLLIVQTRRSVTTRHFAASPSSLDGSLNDVYLDLLLSLQARTIDILLLSRHVLWFPTYSSPLLLIRRESLVLRYTDSRPILLRFRGQNHFSPFFISLVLLYFLLITATIEFLFMRLGAFYRLGLGWEGSYRYFFVLRTWAGMGGEHSTIAPTMKGSFYIARE